MCKGLYSVEQRQVSCVQCCTKTPNSRCLSGALSNYRSDILPSTVAENLDLNPINYEVLLKEVCILSMY